MAIDLNELATALGQIIQRLRLRRRTAAAWTSGNEVLLMAEQGYETDTNKMKIGDGVTAWNVLPYWDSGGGGASVDPMPKGCIGWFSTAHRQGASGESVNYLNAPVDGASRGVIAVADSSVVVFASDGSVASGGIFRFNAPLVLTNCTILAVVKTPGALSGGSATTITSSTATGGLQFRIENSSGTIGLQLVSSGVSAIGDDTSAGTIGTSNKLLVGATLSGTAWTLRRSGAQTASGTTAAIPTVPNSVIGTNSTAGEDATHQLYDLVIFDHVLDSDDMLTAENFLKTLNGI